MKFKIEGIRGGKAAQNFLALPPVLQNRLYYLRYFGGAMVPTIRHRWEKMSQSATYQNVDDFSNTGGMWRGLASRIAGKNAVIEFTRGSISSRDKGIYILNAAMSEAGSDNNLDFVNMLRARKGEPPLRPKKQLTRKQRIKQLKKEGFLKKVSNRTKAKTSQASTSYEMLQPSRDETNTLLTWMQEHLERGVTKNLSSPRELNKRAIPDRFNQLLKRLPNPKNKR